MGTILKGCLQPNDLDRTIKSSCMIEESEMRLEEDSRFCSLITNILCPSMQLPCRMIEWSTSKPNNSGVKMSVPKSDVCHPFNNQLGCCFTDTACKSHHSCQGCDKQVMERHLVEKEVEGEVFGMRPRYLRYNLWSPDADPMIMVVEWTLSALPLP